MKVTPENAWNIVCDYVQDAGLRRHMQSVGLATRWYAEHLNKDEDTQAYWHAVGLLHDFDWEIHANLNEHPIKGADILREKGIDEGTIRTILSHYSEGTGVERESDLDFALLACDEITGLISATSLVRPSKNIGDVQMKSLKKKWKDKRFAAGVGRDHVIEVTEDFSQACFGGNLELWQHIENVLSVQ